MPGAIPNLSEDLGEVRSAEDVGEYDPTRAVGDVNFCPASTHIALGARSVRAWLFAFLSNLI